MPSLIAASSALNKDAFITLFGIDGFLLSKPGVFSLFEVWLLVDRGVI